MKYLKWKYYFKNIILHLPKNYKINVIHYDLIFDHNKSDIEDIDLSKNLFNEVLNYMNDHGNFVINYFNPERLSIEIKLEKLVINFFQNIEHNHIIYDFGNIVNNDNFFDIEKFKIIKPKYNLFILNNINIERIKLFDLNKDLITYSEKIIEIYDNEISINDLFDIYEIIWKDRIKIFWNKNKEVLRLHSFGKLSDINWKKCFIEYFFDIIWNEIIKEEDIRKIIVTKFDNILFNNFYNKN